MRGLPVSLLLLALLGFPALNQAEPEWKASDLTKPADVAAELPAASGKGPLILHVGFAVLYRASHITGSVYAGPGSKPEGIEDLKKALAGQPKDREIVLYCGCCPWEKCPNMRPAFEAVRGLGFTRVHAMVVPENFKTDWVDKGYPTERRAQ